MSISSINSLSNYTTSQLYGVSSSNSNPFQSTTDATSGSTQTTGGIGRFASAIKDAFASLGISLDSSSGTTAGSSTASSSTSTDSTSTDASSSSDAVTAFLQSLFAALHSQANGSTPPPAPADSTTGDSTSSADATSATAATSQTASSSDPTSSSTSQTASVGRGHHGHGGHGGHGGKLEGDLQSLISELTASSSSATSGTTASTDTDSTTATASTSTDSTLSTLEKNFDALLAQNGTTSSSTTTSSSDALTTFLQSLASSLHGAPATGNVVTAEA